jgi:hypothetical protein
MKVGKAEVDLARDDKDQRAKVLSDIFGPKSTYAEACLRMPRTFGGRSAERGPDLGATSNRSVLVVIQWIAPRQSPFASRVDLMDSRSW